MTADKPDFPDYDLNDFNVDQLNCIAGVLNELHGYLPLTVRYQAAAAALDRVRVWTKGAFNATPTEYVEGIAGLAAKDKPDWC